MNYEEKYKQALERARDLMTNQKPPAFDKHLIEMVFPELKESEDKDEMIKQCLIEHIKCNKDLNWSLFQWFKPDTIIAWLEKQGEKKLIENVETKFCEGDKVVSNQNGKVYTVGTAYWVNGDNICLHGTDGNHKWTNEDDLNKNYHLCDAKKLDADNVWLQNYLSNVICFVNQFKKDFGL